MAVTEKDLVFFPDEDEVDQPNVWAATMAQSVSDGIGARLRQQEVAVGIKANLAPASFSMNTTPKTVPFIVSDTHGSFKQGVEISGGVVTIATRGMYLCTVSLGIGASSSQRAVKVELYKGTTKIVMNEAPNSAQFWATAQATCVISCEPGDTIYARGSVTAESSGMLNSNEGAYHFLSIAMVQAVPTP